MYFPDLSPYTYFKQESDPNLLNVGWLDAMHDFPKGTVSGQLLEKLLTLCFQRVNQTRGTHQSPFWPENAQEHGYQVEYKGKRMWLGSAEIRVPGKNGKIYAAPTLIYHYVKDCAYLPPREFLDALEALADNSCKKPMRILYVENHAVFAETVRQKFLVEYSVTVVPSLSLARGKMKENTFDILLVDYDLDDGKGDQLVREVRASASASGKRIVIIGVSSHAEGNSALLKAGADTICSKMDFEQIQNVIERLVG